MKEYDPGLIDGCIRFDCIKDVGMIQNCNGDWVSSDNYVGLSRQLDNAVEDVVSLTRQLSDKEAEMEALRRERDEFKESYRLAMASVNHAYDKGCEATREKAAQVAESRSFRTGNREGHTIATEIRSMPLPTRGE